MSVQGAGIRGLSDRLGQQLALALVNGPQVDVGQVLYVEDAINIRITVWNTGANNAAMSLWVNDFQPTATDSHWKNVPTPELAAIPAGGDTTVVIGNFAHKFVKLQGAGAGGDTTIDLAFCGE